jgi:hypothetical protein
MLDHQRVDIKAENRILERRLGINEESLIADQLEVLPNLHPHKGDIEEWVVLNIDR